MPVVEAVNLRRTYRTTTGTFRRRALEVEAVRGVSFEIGEGELFGLLGPNGAGKTTTIKMLITLLIPTSGSARVLGHDVVEDARVGAGADRLRLRRRPRPLRAALGARQPALLRRALRGRPPERQRQRIDELLELVGLKGREKERVEGYSRGMRQRLHIARGLLHDPPVVFLDEPTIGVDPVGARELRATIASLTAVGQDGAADDALHVRGRPAVRPDRGDREGRDRRRGHAARAEGARQRRHGRRDRGLRRPRARRSSGCARSPACAPSAVEDREQAQLLVVQTEPGAELTQRAARPARRRRRSAASARREPTLEDAYVALVSEA